MLAQNINAKCWDHLMESSIEMVRFQRFFQRKMRSNRHLYNYCRVPWGNKQVKKIDFKILSFLAKMPVHFWTFLQILLEKYSIESVGSQTSFGTHFGSPKGPGTKK